MKYGLTRPLEIIFQFVFSEPVVGFDANDILVDYGRVEGFAVLSPTTFEALVRRLPDNNGTFRDMRIEVPIGAAFDLQGTPSFGGFLNEGPSPAAPGDSVAPTVVISTPTPAPASGPVTIEFRWSEAVQGFTLSDIVVSGTVPGSFGPLASAIDGIGYSVTFFPAPGPAGTLALMIPAGRVIDVAGNSNAVVVQAIQFAGR